MSPTIMSEIGCVSPMLILCLGAFLILGIDIFTKGQWPRATLAGVTLAAAGYAAVHLFLSDAVEPGKVIFGKLVYADDFGMFFNILIIGGSLLSLLIGAGSTKEEGIEAPAEFYSLFLMATAGAMIFISSAELITLFLGLEIMSMALYCMCGAAPSIRKGAESALKYFLLGSFSSAFLLYGIALVYGLTGSTFVEVIAEQVSNSEGNAMLYFALGLLMVGFIFKIGAVPFHFWAPDVYQGAPTFVTTYMAVVIKAAAIAAALRVMWSAFGSIIIFWQGAIWVIAVLTMTVGNLSALRQRSIKRMLAYSSVAHAGYILVAFLAPGDDFGGGAAILFYLVAYAVMTIGAFGVVMAVTAQSAKDHNPDDISRFNGLGFTNPGLGLLLSLFILSLAGLPPGFAGLLGKFYIFNAAVKADFVGIAIIGVINSAISCYYYLNVIVAMYFKDSESAPIRQTIRVGLPMAGALAFCAAGVFVLGLMPSPMHDIASLVLVSF